MYLSRLQDNSIYVNVGETEITPEVTEEMLARKIATYCNIGHTAARAPLVTLLKSRCPTNLGQFEETQPAAK